MKVFLFILCFSVCAFGQTDVCKEIKDASGTKVINIIPVVPDANNSIKPILKAIDDARNLPYSKYPNVIIEVKEGSYLGEEGGIIISPDENTILIDGKEVKVTGRDGICLWGINRPVIKRGKFNVKINNKYEYEPSVIKISGASNIVVKGFELQGTMIESNIDIGPAGISVVNFNKNGISNIHVENNIIHSIGKFYDYGNKNGLWRYKPDEGKEDDRSKCTQPKELGILQTIFNCGQAHGIYVASNQNPISHIFIEGNTLSNLRLGESEAITVGERIFDFEVSGNTIYDVDNIAIDIAGRQNGDYQSSYGTVHSNKIYDLKGASNEGELRGQNSAYPFVAGIYIDGGTGLSWEKSIKVTGNTVTNFGTGIEIGSENKYCNYCNYCKANPNTKDCVKFCEPDKCKSKVCCSKVRVEYILLLGNTLTRNQVYGIGIGKDSEKQNSQTWNVRIVGNTIIDNVLSQDKDHKKYSQLHFGSLEPDSLKSIEVRNNVIKSGGNESLLVRVTGSANLKHLTPDVKFYENVFYSDASKIWTWGISKDKSSDYCKDKSINDCQMLLNSDGKTLNLPQRITGDNNVWGNKIKNE